MRLIVDAFWRALAYCLHPRVILLSLLPLVLMVAGALAFAQWGWWPAVEMLSAALEGTAVQTVVQQALDWMHLGRLMQYFAPMLVIFAITPLIVLLALMLVAVLMMPALVRMVAQRRFATLERKRGGGFVRSLLWSLGHTIAALFLLVISIPLWFVPPLVLLLPPLIWGWLAYRVMSFDALAEHASLQERRELMRRHRIELLGMGIVTGLMGAAPGVVWVSTVVFMAAFALLVPLAVWIYALVFAFAALWFSHFCLSALAALRQESLRAAADAHKADERDGSGGGSAIDVPAREPAALPAPSP